jgi:hypothetical protein
MIENKRISGFSGYFSFLSNFSNHGFYDENGVFFKTNEHFYQYHKTDYIFHKEKILNTETPGKAKRFGKNIRLKENWDVIKIKIMKIGLFYKFTQNFEILEKLMKTDGYYLEEKNTWGDEFWGVYNGKGKNVLGKLLMELRKELKGNYYAMKKLENKDNKKKKLWKDDESEDLELLYGKEVSDETKEKYKKQNMNE